MRVPRQLLCSALRGFLWPTASYRDAKTPHGGLGSRALLKTGNAVRVVKHVHVHVMDTDQQELYIAASNLGRSAFCLPRYAHCSRIAWCCR